MILQQTNNLSKELHTKKMFPYYLASLIQAVTSYILTQQKYGIRWKSAFVRQIKNRSYLKSVGSNFLLNFIIEIFINAARFSKKMWYHFLSQNTKWNLILIKNNLFWTSNSYLMKIPSIFC